MKSTLCALVFLGFNCLPIGYLPASETLRVFILAGQSNMEGQGVVDLDHPKYYNGGKGTLQQVMQVDTSGVYKHLRDDQGNWTERDDVFIRFKTTKAGLKKGPLGIGFTSYPGKHHIGPELQIGHRLGDYYDEPVLLIKTAWGGKSLFKDFRPPSSSGEVGRYYRQMCDEVDEAFNNIRRDFPELKDKSPELAGFIWFQGWNDMYDDAARKEYEPNLVHLIQDVRERWGDNLLVVVGELGNGGPDAGAKMKAIREAQRAAAERRRFRGKVAFVKTAAFARPKHQSPNVSHGHHWFGNAESYFLIGDALGKAMVELQIEHAKKR